MKATFFRCFNTSSLSLARGKTRSSSSSKWLKRQSKDSLVKQAIVDHYRCRSAYKLIELDDKHHFLKKGSIVIDCGARPGSWSQVAARRVGTDRFSQDELVLDSHWSHGMVLALDIEAMAELPGVVVMDKHDLTSLQVQQQVKEFLGGRKANVIMSDMAPNSTGIHSLDHQRIMELCRSVYVLTQSTLSHDGVFLCKLWQGSLVNEFKRELKEDFAMVKECRLKATRKESSEVYLFASGYCM